MTPVDYAFRLRRVCLDRAAAPDDVAALGGHAARWLRYRRMVRSRLIAVIDQAFPRLAAAAGPDAFSELRGAFLESGSLVSPSLRDVPGEFAAWLGSVRSTDADRVPLVALELAALEAAERAVAMELDDPDDELAPLSMDAPAVLTRAHRLLAAEHAVHAVEPARCLTSPPDRTWFCVYRDRESLEVRTLVLSEVAHALLETLARVREPLGDCVAAAAARVGLTLDAAFVRALGDLLGDLSVRGILRGSTASRGACDAG